MTDLPDSLHAWGTDAFAATLKREIEALPPGALPLDGATAHGGRVDDDAAVVATVVSWADARTRIDARVGVFFSEIVAGCSCGDEPFAQPGYCEIEVRIDKASGSAALVLPPA